MNLLQDAPLEVHLLLGGALLAVLLAAGVVGWRVRYNWFNFAFGVGAGGLCVFLAAVIFLFSLALIEDALAHSGWGAAVLITLVLVLIALVIGYIFQKEQAP